MQKARRHPLQQQAVVIGLRPLVSIRFQVLFHSPPGVLFIFRSRYLYTIGHQRVFSLRGWTLQIHTRFHVTGTTWEIIMIRHFFRLQDFHLLWLNFPEHSARNTCNHRCSKTHHDNSRYPENATVLALHIPGLGCFRFVRHYSGNRVFFLLLKLLRCFNSLSCPHCPILFRQWCRGYRFPRRVSPFGNLRFKVCLATNRSLSQPTTSFVGFWYLNIRRILLII